MWVLCKYAGASIVLIDRDSLNTVTLYSAQGEQYNSFSGKVVTGLNPNRRYYLKYTKANDGFTADTELWIRLPYIRFVAEEVVAK